MSRHPAEGLTLRPARDEDALCVAVLAMQVFLDTYATQGLRPILAREVLSLLSPEAIAREMQRPRARLLLAEIDAHLVGFVQWQLHTPHPRLGGAAGAQGAELERLYVQERFTGHGIGRTLLRAVEAQAAAEGASSLWLTAWHGNARARAFYAAQGWEERGSDVYRFEDEVHETRLFQRSLLAGPDRGTEA